MLFFQNELKEIVSTLIGRDHEKETQNRPEVPVEVEEDGNTQNQKLQADIVGEYEGFDKEPVVKRVPWYNARDYDGYKRFGGFDSINHYSSFGKFQKRKNGEDDSDNLLDRLKRAAFDSIHHYSSFGKFNKRSVDRAYFNRGYAAMPSWNRRAFDSIHHYSDFGKFSKRK